MIVLGFYSKLLCLNQQFLSPEVNQEKFIKNGCKSAAHQVKAHAAKRDDQSSIPEHTSWKERTHPGRHPLLTTCTSLSMYVHVHRWDNLNVKSIVPGKLFFFNLTEKSKAKVAMCFLHWILYKEVHYESCSGIFNFWSPLPILYKSDCLHTYL